MAREIDLAKSDIRACVKHDIIKEIQPHVIKEINDQVINQLEKSRAEEEPKQKADEGNLKDEEAIWPNRHLPFFEPGSVQSLTDKQSLEYIEPLFAVMGKGLRMLTMVTGYLEEDMPEAVKAKHTRNLLVHYQQDLTTNETKGRLITEVLTNHLVDLWTTLSTFTAIPGRLNKNTLGDILNELMVHMDGEILPAGNPVIRNLLTLKTILAEPNGVTNMEILQNIAKLTGSALQNELTSGRTINKDGTARDDVGEDFNVWKRGNCNKFPERCVTDLKLDTDRHKVSNWSDMYGLEAKRKGKN